MKTIYYVVGGLIVALLIGSYFFPTNVADDDGMRILPMPGSEVPMNLPGNLTVPAAPVTPVAYVVASSVPTPDRVPGDGEVHTLPWGDMGDGEYHILPYETA